LTFKKFIEKATGIQGIVGHGLESNTKEISVVKFTLPEMEDSTICLVDTPGFDDCNRPDYDIFKMLSKWIIQTYVHPSFQKVPPAY